MSGRQKGGRPALSSGLLQMKFMQRSRLRQDENENVTDQRQLQPKHINAKTTAAQSQFIVEDSYCVVEKLKYGRMSFKGFNPEVEKLMSYYENLNSKPVEAEDEADVTAQEMADRYSSTVTTVLKKFKTKRERSEMEDNSYSSDTSKQLPARKFIKPSD